MGIRNKYTKQFKKDAVDLIIKEGYKIREAGRNLGIHEATLRRWKKEFEQDGEDAFPGKGNLTPEKEEIFRLRKEVQQLKMEREILKKAGGLLCKRIRLRFDFIRQQMKAFPVVLLCKAMEVSRSGFYKYLKMFREKKVDPDLKLILMTKEIFTKSRHTYGARRIARSLSFECDYKVTRYKAKKLMYKACVRVKRKKKFKVTTNSKHKLPVAENVLNRKFKVGAVNKVWCTDITYLWTHEGWMYLAVVIDLFSRKIVGWAIENNMKTHLVEKALKMAYKTRKPDKGLIHHSDRGIQYASNEYQKLLKENKTICSMSRKGNCWDNAVVESFFKTLKTECVYSKNYKTKSEARFDVMDYIEMFYNSNRIHSSIGFKSPNAYEKSNEFMIDMAA
ncbi:MAG: IS3 family transposase [Desulfobacterales bacterium]|nr:IS3 family transposase [Desulfobacterales bacterium]